MSRITHDELNAAANAARMCHNMLTDGELKTQLSRMWWLMNPTHKGKDGQMNPRSCQVSDVALSKDNKTFYVNTPLGNISGQVVVRDDEDKTINLKTGQIYRVSRKTNDLPIPSRGVVFQELLHILRDPDSTDLSEKFEAEEFFTALDEVDKVASRLIGARALIYDDIGVVGTIGTRSWLEPEAVLPLLESDKVQVQLERIQGNGYRAYDDGPTLKAHMGGEVGAIADSIPDDAAEVPSNDGLAQISEEDLSDLIPE